ncbi:MAG: AAA family ATPase, partial [Microgenomates group bacterium]
AMIRIDMSEYQESHTVARLIGAPPGYIGYEEGGQLTEAVRRRPYSVVLFDEVEKAHPQVFNIFLQILDEGRLTDGRGKTVNFRNTIIILTSNLGSEIFSQNLSPSQKEEKLNQILTKFFRPEFLNRLDAIVVYHPLTQETLKKIIKIQLQKLQERLAKQEIQLKVTPEMENYLLKVGYDEVYGARPLRRAIEEKIVNEIALQIIEGKIKPGQKIIADCQKDKPILVPQPAN